MSRRVNHARDEEEAVEKFREFHRLEPHELVYDDTFEMPRRVRCMGPAKWVTYRSKKVIPDTMQRPRKPVDYIHEIESGVELYVPDGELDTEVPEFILEAGSLTLLGQCLGFGFEEDGKKSEAKGERPLPELYCTPDGRALIVVQGKRDILALIWGGELAVEGRGIVG